MKVEKKVNDKKFQPVTLTLTFETEEEYKAYKNLMSREYSIPEYIFGTYQTGIGFVLSRIMDKIYDSMMEVS